MPFAESLQCHWLWALHIFIFSIHTVVLGLHRVPSVVRGLEASASSESLLEMQNPGSPAQLQHYRLSGWDSGVVF